MIKFLLRRISICAVAVGILAFFVGGHNFTAPATAILGSAAAVYKLILWNRVFEALNSNPNGGGIKLMAVFILVLALTLILMIVLAVLNIRLLLCFTAGYLTLPAVIMINSLTEGLNITKNNWGEND